MRDFLRSAFAELYAAEDEMLRLYARSARDAACLEKAAALQTMLEQRDFYGIDTKIEQVAAGLGLTALGLTRPIGAMSGGQRAKVILAKLLLEEPDYRRNLELRQQLYQQEGPIDCFVAVGGNVTSMGRGESGISLGQGLLSPEKIVRLTEDSGLVQRYLSQGLPVIYLLNIKQLAADYVLPYDPAQWPERGTSAVYFETDYPGAVLLLGLAGAAVLLALCRWVRRSAGTARKEERGYHGQTESSADHPDH